VSLEELVAFLRGFEIATFKLPERAAFFDTLPLSGFGKVSKKELAAHLAEGL
jgi:2,3-dihydroxybenzoate-AMP ligase